MITIWVIPLALLLLAGLLVAEQRQSLRGILFIKPFLSALFIGVLLLQPHSLSLAFGFILAGQAACLLGDVCLIFFSQKRVFTLGLAAFLIGHVLYAAAFFSQSTTNPVSWMAVVGILLISGYVLFWLRPHLGNMLGPVAAYVLAISVMAIGACCLIGNPSLPITHRAMIALGALGFYFSDIFVARQRFVQKAFVNRFFGLSLYYLGQFLIAFAAGAL